MASENSSIDPADALMQSLIQSGPNDMSVGSTTGGTGDDDSQLGYRGDDESDMALPQAPGQVIDPDLIAGRAIGRPTSLQSFAVICHQLKQRKNLSPESAAELEVFSVSSSLFPLLTLIFRLLYARMQYL